MNEPTDAEIEILARIIRPWTRCDDNGRFDHGSKQAATAVLVAGYRAPEAVACSDDYEYTARDLLGES